MRCSDVHDFFVSVGPFVTWDRTVDGFKVGDPSREVSKLATVWNPTLDALKEAHERGADLVVSHESVFVHGGAGDETGDVLPSEHGKLDWLRETGLVVYRCHDLWDRFPDIGITWSWQKGLALDGKVVEDRFPLLVTQIVPQTVGDLARHIASRIAPLGQPYVQVCGDVDREVTRVATGTGVTPDPIGMWALQANVGVMTDDYFLWVREGAHAMEQRFPMIVVNHGVSEEWGIENLSRYLAENLRDVSVFHLPQRCVYRTLHAPGEAM